MNKKEGWRRITTILALYSLGVVSVASYGVFDSYFSGYGSISSAFTFLFSMIGLFVLPPWILWYIIGGFIKD